MVPKFDSMRPWFSKSMFMVFMLINVSGGISCCVKSMDVGLLIHESNDCGMLGDCVVVAVVKSGATAGGMSKESAHVKLCGDMAWKFLFRIVFR
jgi:hypothetical protein